jgi:SAM-dependent methyltransferase
MGLIEFFTDVLPNKKKRKAWVYRRMNDFHVKSRTTNRRYELELIYLENADPWSYKTSDYERRKYEDGLKAALRWRKGKARVLEIGCSIGVFTRMLAGAFDEVTAVDVCQEAIALARETVAPAANVRFVRRDIRNLRLGLTYDVIFVSEMLYYLPKSAKAPVLAAIRRHLAPGGVVILVSGRPVGADKFLFFDNWKLLFVEDGFNVLLDEDIADAFRPYVVQIFQPAAG